MKRFISAPNFLKSLMRGSQPDKGEASEPDPQSAAEAAKDRGNAFLSAGKLDQAAQCYQEALRMRPSYAEVCVNLGIVLRQQARIAEAETLFARAAELKPSLWQAYFNLGMVAESMGRPNEAISQYQRVLNIQPSYLKSCDRPEVHWRLACVYASQGRYNESLQLSQEIIGYSPAWIEVQRNIGAALSQLGRHEEALAQFKHVAAMDPNNAEAIFCLGICYQQLHQWEDARRCYARVCVLDPQHFDAQERQAFLSLLLGDYQNGWVQYEKILPHLFRKMPDADGKILSRRTFMPEKYWDGRNLEGKALLVWTEHGFGDNLMMVRYLPLIRARGAGKIIVHCEAPLARVFETLPDADEVVVKTGRIVDLSFDRHCSMMSLPYLFRTRLDTIPNRVPYISVPPTAKAYWKSRLEVLPGFKVGIAWAGNNHFALDRQRSLDLNKFGPLFSIADVTWVSLQKGGRAEQLKEVNGSIHDWMDECEDFQDTGALMENLDLIITVDTSVVHLAGALGRPTWLLNRYGSEWRWLLDREDSPWYPTVRIFRQPASEDWDSVIERMTSELRTLSRS